MEINLNFKSLEDFEQDLPKFVGDLSLQTGLYCTPAEGESLTKEDLEVIKDLVIELIKDPEAFDKKYSKKEEKKPDKKSAPAKKEAPKKEPEEEKPQEKPGAKAEPKQEGPTEANMRKRFNKMIKNMRTSVGVKMIFKYFKVKNFTELDSSQYAEAWELADKFEEMSEEEFDAAAKEEGFEVKRKEA